MNYRIIGCLILTISGLLYKANQALAAEEALVPVVTSAVRISPLIQHVSTYGTLAPRTEELSFKISGRIDRFHAQEGDHIESGQLLAELETQDAEDALDKERVQLEQAQRAFNRMETLLDKGSIQKSELEDASVTLEQNRIAYEQARLNLTRCALIAPSNGLILKEFVDSRTTVAAGQAIYSFQSDQAVWITKVGLTDRNAFALGEGAVAHVRFAPYPGVIFEGELTKLARVANPGDALYTAELTISSNGHVLRPGMIAEVDLYQDSGRHLTTVPFDALVDLRGQNGTIYLVDEQQGTVREHQVTLVSVQGTDAFLKESLPDYSRVVIRGQQNIIDGSRIDAK